MSDLHADRRDPAAATASIDSHLDITVSESQVSQHPLAALEQLIVEQRLRANLLLCPGDITNKAKPEPLQYAWRRIHDIGRLLGAELVAGTVGNHDVDSRFAYTDHDAKGMVQEVQPPFPLADEHANDRYWSRHYVLVERDQYRLLVLNSAAYHGAKTNEIEHGRVSKRTLDRIRYEVTGAVDARPEKVNILLCHHHPERHPTLTVPDYDAMVLGPDLLQLLGSGKYGRWLVIHGHKHDPRLTYAGGSATSPIVFSAGSLSVVLYPELQNRARNQFYLLELYPDELSRLGLVGSGRAWDFVPGQRWVPAGAGSGLPAYFGFGSRLEPNVWASRLANEVDAFRLWDAVVEAHPELRFVLPEDLSAIEDVLEKRHQIVITWRKGRPFQIGRSA